MTSDQEFDEDQLIESAKTDPDAFGQLYELYVDRVYNYIYYRVGNHHDAEDLTAKVFFRALNHIPRYKNMADLNEELENDESKLDVLQKPFHRK